MDLKFHDTKKIYESIKPMVYAICFILAMIFVFGTIGISINEANTIQNVKIDIFTNITANTTNKEVIELINNRCTENDVKSLIFQNTAMCKEQMRSTFISYRK